MISPSNELSRRCPARRLPRRSSSKGSNGCCTPNYAGFLALAGARYGHEWWSVGRFIENTDDAYAGGNVTPISPHVAGFVAQILVGDNEYVRAGGSR